MIGKCPGLYGKEGVIQYACTAGPLLVRRRGSCLMWTSLSLLANLVSFALGVYYLLLLYRRIGKPEGADPEYDAGYRRWSGTYKLLGWGGSPSRSWG